LFSPAADAADGEEVGAKQEGEEEEFMEREDGEDEHAPILPLSRWELEKLYRFPLITRRVTQQTGKGKIHRRGVLVVVGNGNGLVGYGEAKHDDPSRATNRAFAMAVRSMDYVDRFENRTIWTEMSDKLGATRIILRPRPVGFGLHCNPNIHQVLKAAGIKDISAKVWGSRNPLNVIKLLFRMLHAGNAPLAMGNGIGGPGRKLDKGSGVRGKQEIERERGRKLFNLRTR
jgi:small subunit ribosomal protein S5